MSSSPKQKTEYFEDAKRVYRELEGPISIIHFNAMLSVCVAAAGQGTFINSIFLFHHLRWLGICYA